MLNLGPVPASSTLYIPFATYDSNGASVTLTGLAVTDIEIYKAGSVTQRASDAGYTLLDTDGIDFDGITGIHGFSIDLSDNTDAGFYAVGSWYWVVVSAVTVDSQTVNFVAAVFRIVAAEGVTGKPKVDVDAFGGTAGTFSGGRPEVNASHAAGTAWNSGAITANTLAADAITAAKIADGAIDAATFAAGAITATVIATDAIDADALAANAVTEIQAGLATAAALDTVDDFLDTEIAAIKAKTDNLPSDPADQSAVEAAITAAQTAILARLTGIVLEAGTIGATGNDTTHVHLNAFTYGDDEINNYLLVIYDASEDEYHARWIEDWVNASKLATVATLPFTPQNSTDGYFLLPIRQDVTGGSGLDAAGVRAAIGLASANLDTQLDALPTAAENTTAVWGAAARTLTALDEDSTTLDLDATIRAAVGLAAANLDTQLTAIDDYLDTEVAAIKAKTDQLTFTGANRVDANVEAIGNDTTALANFKRSAATIVRGTCDTGASTTSIPTSSLSPAASVADQFKGRIVIFDKDTSTAALRGQATDITASSNTGTLTVTALTTSPASGDTFVIV